jgi:hypothetical protein
MRCLIVASLLASLASCSGSSAGPDADVVDSGIGCKLDPRQDMYAPNLTKAGKMGKLTFVLVSSDPGPPIKGNNTWEVQVLDSSMQPVTGATMTAKPFMPDHGHGTSVVPIVSADGMSYMVTPLYLFMPGLWQVTLNATSGGTTDSAVFSFCIQG